MSSDGTVVAIGAPYIVNGNDSSGHVRVYHYNETTAGWNQMGSDIDGEADNDFSGSSVSLSSNGSVVAIGATGLYYNYGITGHVRLPLTFNNSEHFILVS